VSHYEKCADVLFSGGKDSSYALFLASGTGYEITGLLNLRPTYEDSLLYHRVGGPVVGLQAESMGLPLKIIEIPSPDLEVELLKSALSGLDVDVLVCGVLESEYQRSIIHDVCEILGIENLNPLWGKNNPEMLREMICSGFEIMVASVAAEGLEKEWLGRVLDNVAVDELLALSSKYRFSPMGEGGEYETLVLSSPMMKQKIEVEFDLHWERDRGTIEVLSASLVDI